MKELLSKVRPASGFAHFTHIALRILLPVLAFVLVRIDFGQLALALVLISKWRMFSVRPRHWPAIVRANAVDLIAGASFVLAMDYTNVQKWQLIWALFYAVWLAYIKPQSTQFFIGLQAIMAQTLGLTVSYLLLVNLNASWLVIAVWLICYLSARHYLSAFDEQLARPVAQSWAFFAAAFTLVMGRWMLFYGVVAQAVIALSICAYGFAAMYYLDEIGKLTPAIKRQFVFVMSVVVLFIIILADWGDKVIKY